MPRIVYGNPVTEIDPVLNYRKNYPSGGGLVTVDATLVREVTASTLYIANLVETAQRLTLADEVIANGNSYGTGWTLTASESLGAEGGFETVRLRYLKANVSPLEYGNPAALSISLTATQGIVKWHGAPAIVYESDNSREGFQLVAGGSGALTAFSMPVSNRINHGGGLDGVNPFEYVAGPGSAQSISGRAYNLTLGGKPVATAIDPPPIVRYTRGGRLGDVGFVGAPCVVVRFMGGTYASEAEARTAGEAYYTATFKPEVQGYAATAAAYLAAGGIVLGYTAVSDGGVKTEVTGSNQQGDLWGYTVWMRADNNYILAQTLDANNSAVDWERYQYPEDKHYRPDRYFASPAWTLAEDSATCRVGGGVLLTVPPDSSDSGSAS